MPNHFSDLRPRRQTVRGFTLIELVVVLSIMAVLVAVALPRMMNMQRDARIGALEGVRGSVAASATLVHSAMLSRRGAPDPTACPADGGLVADNQLVGPGTACTESGVIHTMNGYPASTALGTPGIVSAAGVGSTFNPSAADLAHDGFVVTVGPGNTTFQRIDAASPATCGFTYTDAPVASTAAVFSTAVTSGC